MKTTNILSITSAICLLGWSQALAQFSSGSTGADGPLNVISNMTLNLPTNGIFNFTTITVSNVATLAFNRNPLNTPVYLLATGDVLILGNINVSGSPGSGQVTGGTGKGGPGGFDGGLGPFASFPHGDGQGPGGGRYPSALQAAFAFPAGNNSNVYGNTLLSPLIGGSGGAGGGGNSGAGGGGAILLASTTTITVNGNISANGGESGSPGAIGAGSGGAIRAVAPIVTGNGSLTANGGTGASAGRTRIDSEDRFAHRSLTLSKKATRGSQMVVFPPGNPRLDIIHAAGRDITEGTNAAITINLPIGSSTNQIVRVQARNFTGDIPIRVKITPENAPSATYDTVITNTANPSVGEVTVTLPLDTVTYVHAWTR